MLSAVVQLLHGIRQEHAKERKIAIIDLCSSAFPDVRPWQVAKSCGVGQEDSSKASEDMLYLYYTYLTLLLHPVDGHDSARHDPCLVKVCYVLSCFYVGTPSILYLMQGNFRAVKRNGWNSQWNTFRIRIIMAGRMISLTISLQLHLVPPVAILRINVILPFC